MSRIAGLFTALVILGGSASAPASADAPDPPGTLTFGGLQRNYVLHVPPGPPAGLVINLHGAGMSGQDQAAVTGYDAVAIRYVGEPLRYRRVALASYLAYAFSMNLGFAPITGSAVAAATSEAK